MQSTIPFLQTSSAKKLFHIKCLILSLVFSCSGCASLFDEAAPVGGAPQVKKVGVTKGDSSGATSSQRKISVPPQPVLLPQLPRITPIEVRGEYGRLQVQPRSLLSATKRSGRSLASLAKILEKHSVPSDLLIVALIESGFNPEARSPDGNHVGLWQFSKGTGRHYGLKIGFLFDERSDPERSTEAAARHLSDLFNEFQDWPLALAAYNAGSGRIRGACASLPKCDYWALIRARSLPPVTIRYVPRIIAALLYLEDRRLWPLAADFSGFPEEG